MATREPAYATVDEILDEARNGRLLVVVDADGSIDGALVLPAQMVTPAAINFMARFGQGLICLALTQDRADQLHLPSMGERNGLSFTVSIEAREGVSTGISAADRSRTIAIAIDGSRGPDALATPGHVFPIVAREGGVLVRANHTEAAVDIARLAGLNQSAVVCKILGESGMTASTPELAIFARQHNLKICRINDLVSYRARRDSLIRRVTSRPFASRFGGDWTAVTYRHTVDEGEFIALVKGRPEPDQETFVTIHSLNILDDILGDPEHGASPLASIMAVVARRGNGVVILLNGRSGTSPGARREDQDRDWRAGLRRQVLAELGIQCAALLESSPLGESGR
jgi:3,4-dihydroxy 2-butanone 4-phosphate synthase/GTP cyclohydrolase II